MKPFVFGLKRDLKRGFKEDFKAGLNGDLNRVLKRCLMRSLKGGLKGGLNSFPRLKPKRFLIWFKGGFKHPSFGVWFKPHRLKSKRFLV